jgi:SAM-dependent methyltransferase
MKDRVGIFLMRWRIRKVLDCLRGDVLDVGCGTNELVKTYRMRYPEHSAVGVDVYPWEGVDRVIAHAATLPFANASFDTICCIAALNHIPERKEFLLEARRVLRPNGCLVLTMLPPGISRLWHFLRSPWDADQRERGMKVEGGGEVYGLTRAQMCELLRTAGFALKNERSFMLGVNTLYIAEPV